MLIYFAGSEPKDYARLLKENGAEGILESAYSLNYKKEPNHLKFKNYILDSGGYTARVNHKIVDVKQYADYINKYKVKIAFNLDTNDVKETLKNQEYLDKNTKCYIIPVYHDTEYISKHRDILQDYIKKYPLIALGGIANSDLTIKQRMQMGNYIFKHAKDKVKVHGLGICRINMLERYPWYSIDNTDWLCFARYGASRCNTKEMAKVKARTRHYKINLVEEIKYWIKLTKYITDLWKMRGIEWK